MLANDTDPDGDSLTIVSIVPPLNGSVIPNLSATNITYTPSTDFAGVDTFQYQISDGHGGSSLLATVTITVNATGPASYVVNNTLDSGPGSLRQAMLNSNLNVGSPNTISFQIGTGLATIAPLTPLPNITVPVLIDGTTQPGFTNTPIIELNGTERLRRAQRQRWRDHRSRADPQSLHESGDPVEHRDRKHGARQLYRHRCKRHSRDGNLRGVQVTRR